MYGIWDGAGRLVSSEGLEVVSVPPLYLTLEAEASTPAQISEHCLGGGGEGRGGGWIGVLCVCVVFRSSPRVRCMLLAILAEGI